VRLRVFLLPRDRCGRAASPEIRSLLLDKSVLVAAAAVALAAIGWGIIEPLLPAQLIRTGVTPGGIGLIFTAGSPTASARRSSAGFRTGCRSAG
jgi:hypothetical protein